MLVTASTGLTSERCMETANILLLSEMQTTGGRQSIYFVLSMLGPIHGVALYCLSIYTSSGQRSSIYQTQFPHATYQKQLCPRRPVLICEWRVPKAPVLCFVPVAVQGLAVSAVCACIQRGWRQYITLISFVNYRP